MKAFFFVFASILSALTMAKHVPGHATPRKYGKHPNYFTDDNRVLMYGGGLGDDIGNDDDGDAGGLGGIGDIGGAGGVGGPGGIGGLGGIGDAGGLGGRALRGLSDELVDDGTVANDNDEIVVAGRAVARGGAVVARPGPRRWYY
ncbi:hypothetical protein PI124_g11191 [Phytophthora idaei]|nr:hypothetical protein PI125_g2913 [Phytophthora idaei]KAG3164405.1 hypothetical protein PI126_g5101 [Phytophthora idaei]KAG3244011.1 hypothetical protein PI124_g11191 [Phytophthora idaei]